MLQLASSSCCTTTSLCVGEQCRENNADARIGFFFFVASEECRSFLERKNACCWEISFRGLEFRPDSQAVDEILE